MSRHNTAILRAMLLEWLKMSFINVVSTLVASRLKLYTYTPEDIGNTEDAERLMATGPGFGWSDAGYDGTVTLHPDVTSTFHKHPVLTTD